MNITIGTLFKLYINCSPSVRYIMGWLGLTMPSLLCILTIVEFSLDNYIQSLVVYSSLVNLSWFEYVYIIKNELLKWIFNSNVTFRIQGECFYYLFHGMHNITRTWCRTTTQNLSTKCQKTKKKRVREPTHCLNLPEFCWTKKTTQKTDCTKLA